jgi:hypothetical protein
MVGSDYCTSNFFDDIISDDNPGGYFIINGKIKYIVPFERVSTNDILVFKDKDN